MKEFQDRSRRDVEFAQGDWVWLRLTQRSAAGITVAGNAKLAPRYYGPFQVLERVGSVAYKLALPSTAKIHNVFHVVFLKKFVGTPPDSPVALPPLVHGRVLPAPSQVVKARLNRGTWELLVKWEGRSAADATWEQLNWFREAYPDYQLEDELFQKEGGSIVDAFVGKQYARRHDS